MSPDVWNNIAVGAFSAGTVFLIVALIMSVKFRLILIIRSALESHRDSKMPAKQGFFEYRQEPVSEGSANAQPAAPPRNEATPVYSGGNASDTVISEEAKVSATVIAEDEGTVTTVITSEEDPEISGTVIISPDEPENKLNTDEFIILNDIIVINGSTDSVKRRKSKSLSS